MTALKATLARFRRRLAGQASAHEGVTAHVRRRVGFAHAATTASGLRISLDEPVAFGGTGRAPDPAEHLLAAVGASVSVTITAHAALSDVPIETIEVDLSAAIDAHEFFHPGSGGRQGLHSIEVHVAIRSAAPRKALAAVVRDALKVAPVLRSLRGRPRVRVSITAPKA